MDTLALIFQAFLLAIFGILVILLAIFSMLLTSSGKKTTTTESDEEVEGDVPNTIQAKEIPRKIEVPEEVVSQREEETWLRYPQVYRMEILYWRGVSKPWWWNNYAQELLDYAEEFMPIRKLSYYATYNSNSKGQDYTNPLYQKRIQALRPHKVSKHPLVIINYDQEFIMVDSAPALELMKDRIDAEWMRHYRFKKTYRR